MPYRIFVPAVEARARPVAARKVAVWAFHGAEDDAVPVARSGELVDALRAAGGMVRYTEYPDVDHLVWNRAYIEPELPEWLFKQTRALR
jgi:predicted peptidase